MAHVLSLLTEKLQAFFPYQQPHSTLILYKRVHLLYSASPPSVCASSLLYHHDHELLFGCLANRQEDQSKAVAMASPRRASSRCLLLGSWSKSKKQVAQVEQMVEDGPKNIKGAIRVKLVLSKKEAAQLLVMYVRGQEEMADTLVGALDSMKNRRRSGSGSGSWRPMLESIPES